MASILEAALDGSKKTRIMHVANVNYKSFRRYFSGLMIEGLIVEVEDPDGGVLYRTTEDGRDFLKSFRNFLLRRRGGSVQLKYRKLP